MVSKLSPEKLFLIFTILFGLSFSFLTPPLQAPDEEAHFLRAYQISEGHLLGEVSSNIPGGFLPESIGIFASKFNHLTGIKEEKTNIGQIIESLRIPTEKNKRIFYDFRNTVLYTPVPYFPQIIGVWLFSFSNLSPIYPFYAGRLLNLAVWIFLVYTSIRLLPSFKWVLFALALMPMSIFLAGSLSADPITIGSSFLFIALILRFRTQESTLTKKEIFSLFAISLVVAASKQVYFPLGLLILIIPSEKFRSQKIHFLFMLLILITNVMLAGIWNYIIKSRGLFLGMSDVTDDSRLQINIILQHPIEYLHVLFKTFFKYGHLTLEQFVGQLGWLDTILPPFIWKGYWILLCFTAILDKGTKLKLNLNAKAVIGFVLFTIIFLICLALYLQSSPLGADSIGLQGRYFIPVSPLLFLLFYNQKIPAFFSRSKWPGLILATFVFLTLGYTLFVVYNRYYGLGGT